MNRKQEVRSDLPEVLHVSVDSLEESVGVARVPAVLKWVSVTAARRCRPLLPTVSVEPILERMRLSW